MKSAVSGAQCFHTASANYGHSPVTAIEPRKSSIYCPREKRSKVGVGLEAVIYAVQPKGGYVSEADHHDRQIAGSPVVFRHHTPPVARGAHAPAFVGIHPLTLPCEGSKNTPRMRQRSQRAHRQRH